MALFLLSSVFIFSTSSSLIHSSYVPPLLFLTCIPSLSNTIPIENILDNLTMETPTSHYTTFWQGQYGGFVQCRPGISPANCTLCKETARSTILNSCDDSNGVSAWFDGCYVQISSYNASTNISNHSCSGRTDVQDPAKFEPAIGTLFLMLRADIAIPTRRGFSYREIGYEDGKIYGLVECLRSVPTQECDSCVAEATDELLFYCGGKNGGILMRGMCLVRFESSEFYHRDVSSEGGVSLRGNYFSVEDENGGESKKKVVVVYWSGGVGCFVLVVLLIWLLRRRVLNRAKVGTSDFAGFDPTPTPTPPPTKTVY